MGGRAERGDGWGQGEAMPGENVEKDERASNWLLQVHLSTFCSRDSRNVLQSLYCRDCKTAFDSLRLCACVRECVFVCPREKERESAFGSRQTR